MLTTPVVLTTPDVGTSGWLLDDDADHTRGTGHIRRWHVGVCCLMMMPTTPVVLATPDVGTSGWLLDDDADHTRGTDHTRRWHVGVVA
jgi:hypothetical protein